MLIDESLYSWKPHAPEPFVTEAAGSISFAPDARRVYMVEVAGLSITPEFLRTFGFRP